MGFKTLRADLLDPNTHDPGFWSSHLPTIDYVVNAAGVLTGTDRDMNAIHCAAPSALYRAMRPGTRAVLISAVGIETGDTAFARHRRSGEAIASLYPVTILRAGLVLGDTSYGGSSLARALATLPWVTPVIGTGVQRFNPIHANDLAAIVQACLQTSPGTDPHDVGGPETVTQSQMLEALRAWIGLPKAKVLHLPMTMARTLGRVGDMLRFGPISRTSVDQLSAGVLADSHQIPGPPPRGFSTFLAARPPGTQDLWHARLYLIRPVLRLTLALLWLMSGMLGLLLSPDAFLPLVQSTTLPEQALIALARIGGIADLAIALALLRAWKLKLMWRLQLGLITAYTAAFSFLAPELWALPLGGLLKNLPLLLLVIIHGILEDER